MNFTLTPLWELGLFQCVLSQFEIEQYAKAKKTDSRRFVLVIISPI
jgi:hypothetical protein